MDGFSFFEERERCSQAPSMLLCRLQKRLGLPSSHYKCLEEELDECLNEEPDDTISIGEQECF